MTRLFKYILLAIVLATPTASFSGGRLDYLKGVATTVAGFTCGGSELICDDFDGATTCAGLGYTVYDDANCSNQDYVTMTYGDATGDFIYQSVSAQSTIFIKINIKITVGDHDLSIIRLQNGSTPESYLWMRSNETFGLTHAGSGGSSTGQGSWTVGDWYTVKVKYVKGTGANSEGYLWYAAGKNQSLPTSTAAADYSFTNGGATLDIDRVVLRCYSGSGYTYMDNHQTSTTDPDS